jgi:lysozyme family protein
MKENFDRAFSFVCSPSIEGGYVNDPADPGGETKFGISKRSYPDLEIRNLTAEQAKEIYRRDYWEKAGCNGLPWPLDVITFDCAVNQGVSFAKELAHECKDPLAAMMYRLRRYSDIVARRRTSEKFLRGWINRIIQLSDFVRKTA